MVELWTFDLTAVFELIHPAHSLQNLEFFSDFSCPITTRNWILAVSSSITHAAKCIVYVCASLTHGMPRLALQETISGFSLSLSLFRFVFCMRMCVFWCYVGKDIQASLQVRRVLLQNGAFIGSLHRNIYLAELRCTKHRTCKRLISVWSKAHW
jgi:hypothetical protein